MVAEQTPVDQTTAVVAGPLPSFIISQSMLQKALKSAGSLVSKREPIVPILGNILLAVSDDQIRLTGSDLRDRVSVDLPVERGENAAHFRTTVDFPRFAKLINSLPEQPLTIRYDDAASRLTVEAFSAEYRFATDWAIDYPKLAEFPPVWNGPGEPNKTHHDIVSFTAPTALLRSLMTPTLPFCSNDDLRPAMTGLHFGRTPDGPGLDVAGTDGHRLVRQRTRSVTVPEGVSYILPQRVAAALLAIMPPDSREESVVVEFSHVMARFTWPSHVVTCRLIDERYPDYGHLLTKAHQNNVRTTTLDRRLLLAVLNRVEQFTNGYTRQIALTLTESRLDIRAEDLDHQADCRERIDVRADIDGALTIGFNARLLIHLLKQIKTNQVQLACGQASQCALVNPVVDSQPDTNSTFMIMPVMLNTYD